jgi:nucleoside-diphosphate-sugar epimerase
MYLITGGGGFIGSHLVRELVRSGERIRVLDDSSTGSRNRIADVLTDVEWIPGDVRDTEAVQRACKGVEVVLHHAAIASVPHSVREPELTHEVNATGTLNVLSGARAAGVRRVVFASSAAIYGDLATSPKVESLPARPVSPYGVQKLSAELYCRIYPSLYGVETVALRYFNIFGPGQDPATDNAAVIPQFISAILSGGSPTVYGDGEQTRDFLFVRNVVEINLLAATVPAANGAVLNVGSGVATSLNQLLAELQRTTEQDINATYQPERIGDIRESVADIGLLRATLGYTPTISFADGLARTVAAYRQEIGSQAGV